MYGTAEIRSNVTRKKKKKLGLIGSEYCLFPIAPLTKLIVDELVTVLADKYEIMLSLFMSHESR